MRIIDLIEAIRTSFPDAEYVYKNGGCYKFHLILKAAFAEAQPWYDGIEGHVITKLGPKFYDVTGELTKKDHWYPLEQEPRIFAEAAEWECKKEIQPTWFDRLLEALKPRPRDDEAFKTMKQIVLKGRISLEDRHKLIDGLINGR